MTFKVIITGDKEVVQALTKVSKKVLGPMIEPLTSSSQMYVSEILKNFKTSGGTFNEPWKSLSPVTIKIKKKLKEQGRAIAVEQPLVRTGKMRGSFKYEIKPKHASIYNIQQYSDIHQEGGTATFHGKKVTIPKRILLKVDLVRVNLVAHIFENWVKKLVREFNTK